MPVGGVITVSVPVADQGRALDFYVGTLGLRLTRMDETAPGVRRVHVTGDGATCLSLVTWCAPMPPGCLRGLVLRSSDLAADYQRLVAAGVEFDGPPFTGPDGTCQAVCYDPDGNALILQGGRKMASPGLSSALMPGRARGNVASPAPLAAGACLDTH